MRMGKLTDSTRAPTGPSRPSVKEEVSGRNGDKKHDENEGSAKQAKAWRKLARSIVQRENISSAMEESQVLHEMVRRSSAGASCHTLQRVHEKGSVQRIVLITARRAVSKGWY